MQTLHDKIERNSGLCTSLGHSDEENANRIRFILDTFLSGQVLERSSRAADNWEIVWHMPQEFHSYRFRTLR